MAKIRILSFFKLSSHNCVINHIMAGTTKCHSIFNRIAELWKITPRFNMVSNQFTPWKFCFTRLASIFISIKNLSSPNPISHINFSTSPSVNIIPRSATIHRISLAQSIFREFLGIGFIRAIFTTIKSSMHFVRIGIEGSVAK